MPDLLLEIGAEEIPAGFLPGAITQLKEASEKLLEESGLALGEVKSYASPRRLVLTVRGLAERQPDRIEEVSGPPSRIAFDDQGNPTRAALGFARTSGVSVDQLIKLETPKGEYLGVRLEKKGKETKVILKTLLPELIKALHFPKTMKWGDNDFRFVRPVHWVLAILGEETLNFEIAGIQSGNFSFGHRFLAPDKFEVAGIDDYFEKTRQHKVIVDQDERKQRIIEGLEKEIENLFPNLEYSYGPKELIGEVTFLVEYPLIVSGGFDEEFLKLPQSVTETSAAKNQKYYMVTAYDREREIKTLRNLFFTISNMPDTEGLIKEGNERVLRARLSDAQFFYAEDLREWPDKFIEDLKGIIFQKKLGTVYQKAERNAKVAQYLLKTIEFKHERDSSDFLVDSGNLNEFSFLCKADLATQMVGEFPELQGEMGYQYQQEKATEKGFSISSYIIEHYLPRNPDDVLPMTLAGNLLSIADKLDTICGCFSIGQKPTGSKDPFALRRGALGIIRISLRNTNRFNLKAAINKSLSFYPDYKNPDKIATEVFDFFKERLKQLRLAKGYQYDLVEAALESDWNDIRDVEKRMDALVAVSKRESFNDLMITFKRASRILPKERLSQSRVSENLLQEAAEKKLFECFREISEGVEPLLHVQKYQAALAEMVKLKPSLDTFFDQVMVMDEDARLRENRLALLNNITNLFGQVADVSKIVI